jgi:ABC-type nitrate/sulfonate/bicarbonate transport system substrate-binding protein
LGANSIAWSAQSSQATYVIMVSRNDRITQHPELVRRFLNSLAEGGSIS